ncbi:MAG: SEL1-like repeat protein, partial [Lysobacterales bacterium]
AAQFNLAVLYGDGLGVLKDYVQAHMWAYLAAAQNQENATKLRAALAEQMTHEQIAEAQRLAREWMAQHQADFRAGLDAYNQGDYATALKEWQPLAEQGDAAAQFNLGGMYSLGQGVPQDDQEAVRWWRLAAEQGDAAAQFNLGVSYDQGRGVPQDYAQARDWYLKAAEQGHALAQANLGVMYWMGPGVLQDYVQAHMWVNLAGAQGHVGAAKARRIIEKK